MDTIEQLLIKLALIKENIRQAINSRGVVLTTDDVFSIYPDAIMRIGIHKITTSFEGIISDAPLTIKDEKSLTINLTPESGINIGLVTVLMGNDDITSTSYSNGVISISNVTDDVSITAIGIIDFADSTVKSLCVSNWGSDIVLDEITIGEAMLVTSLDGVFRNNRSITSFNELKFFTGLTQFTTTSNSGQGEFYNCVALASVILPSATIDGGMRGLFCVCSNLTEIDLSPLKTRSSFNIYYMCRLARVGTKLKKVILPGGYYNGSAGYAFVNQAGLTTIEINGTANFGVTSFSSAFSSCTSLTTITGNITGISVDISFRYSPLDKSSALVILNGLAQVQTAKKVTFSYSTYNLLTDADIAIATAKNWQVETIIEWDDNNLRDYILAQFPNNVGLSYSGQITNLELATITSLDGKFRGLEYFDENNTKPFHTFNEFKFFTGIDNLTATFDSGGYALGEFYNCTKLATITLPKANITKYNGVTPNSNLTILNGLFRGSGVTSINLTPLIPASEGLTLSCLFRDTRYLTTVTLKGCKYKSAASYVFRRANSIVDSLVSINIDGTANFLDVIWSNSFNQCVHLTTITGTCIGINNTISFQYSPLTRASALVILNGLDQVSTVKKITFKYSTYNLLTDADIAIATTKNWQVETIVEFEDQVVKSKLLQNFPNNVGLTYANEITNLELATITTLNGVFKEDANITSFNELKFFTGLTSLAIVTSSASALQGEFYNCVNLTSVVLPKINLSSIRIDGAFKYTSISELDLRPFGNTAVDMQGVLNENSDITKVYLPKVGTQRFTWAFRNCQSLTTLDASEGSDWTDVFRFEDFVKGCTSLTTIIGTITGIGESIRSTATNKYPPDFSDCPLTADSAMVILNGLADLTGKKSWALTLNSGTKAALTSAGIDYDAIAAAKNWTIA